MTDTYLTPDATATDPVDNGVGESGAADPMALLGGLLDGSRIGQHHQVVRARILRHTPDVADMELTDGRRGRMAATDFYPNRRWEKDGEWMALIVDGHSSPVRLSCTHPDLVRVLLESQVPELRDGQVRIMRIARRPGIRCKVAVAGTSDDVDAVGHSLGRAACRTRAVSAMLGGERVDVVAWHPDPLIHASNALAVRAVGRDVGENGAIRITVPPYQMEAARGGGNLNLHLAAQLVGRRIELAETT